MSVCRSQRRGRGYPSNLSDREWSQLCGLLKRPAGGRGRPSRHPRRLIVNAIRYLVRTGCPWRYLPKGFPPHQTVYWHFRRWSASGLLRRVHAVLLRRCRIRRDRAAQPSAAVIDSQSVRGADTVPRASRGWDNGKKVNGRKRHIVVDTQGLLLAVAVTPANRHDATAARELLKLAARRFPRIARVWADTSYQGKLVDYAAAELGIDVCVVRRPKDQHTFTVLPRRWVVERSLAWLSKHRRLVRDYETNPACHIAMVQWASTAQMLNHLTRE